MSSQARTPIGDASARGPRQVGACVLLALIAWSGSILRGGSSSGERESIFENPITALSLRIDHSVWGEHAAGWHATNVALHAACVALLGIVLLMLGPARADRPLPWLGLALFAVHPVLADTVAPLGGRASMLGALGGLLAAAGLLWISVPWRPPTSRRCMLAAICATSGMFAATSSDPFAVVFAVPIALIARRHSRPMFVAASIGALAGIAAARALAGDVVGWPISALTTSDRLLAGGRAMLEALRIAVAPIRYPPSYAHSSLFDPPRIATALAVLGWSAWLALLGIGAWSVRRRSRSIAGWSLVLAMLALAPVLRVSRSSPAFAPGMLYLPLLFAAPLLDAMLLAVFARTKLSAVLAGLAAVALCVACWERSALYADRGAYQQAILAVEPGDAAAHLELAEFLEGSSQPERARAEFDRAVALAPRNARGHIGLGRVAAARGDAASAANEFGIATHLAPDSLEAWRGLARARFEHGDREAANDALAHALALGPSDAATLALAARMRDAQPAR